MIRAACALAIASAGCRAGASGGRGRDAQAGEPPTCAAIYQGAPGRLGIGRAGQPVRVAALADARGADPATLDAVEDLARQLAAARADLVLALGGMAGDQAGLERLFGALARAEAPIAALPGDREPQEAFHAALDRARGDGGAREVPELIDLQRQRVLDGPALDLVALPGYRWPTYLGEGDCRYRAADLPPLAELAARTDGPRLLAAYTPPAGVGDSLDGAALGDPDLRRALPPELAPYGLFGHGRGATAAEGEWSVRLDVAVGAADAAGCPEAVLLEVDSGRARFRRLHARSPRCEAAP